MPVTFTESDIKRQEGLWAGLPEDLDLLPEMNGRHNLPDIEWLIQSILEPHGQIQPCPIRKTAGRPVLTAGFSRYRAVAEINKRGLTPNPLRLNCVFKQLTDQQAFIANIHENRVRNPTVEIDDAYNLQRLINVFQMSEEEAGKVYNENVKWVRSRLQLLELSPEAEKEVRSGRVVPSAAKAIARLSREQQKKVLAKPGKITSADVKRETPAPTKKADKPDLQKALRVLLAEAATQPEAMIVEIHRDTIRAVREALK